VKDKGKEMKTQILNTSHLLTADEAAQLTGLAPTTIRRLAWQRRVRSYKILGALRFRVEDLEALAIERPTRERREEACV
jgi:excisionase family DNA binding protein